MTPQQIAQRRLYGQQVSLPAFKNITALVQYMGALQAQDFAMSRWAIGLRLPGKQEKDVHRALDSGKILRTHVLRPTWHIVAAKDIRWILDLSVPQLQPLLRGRLRELELDEKILVKATKIISRELGKAHCTREELMTVLNKAGIATNEYRSGHIMLQAELNGLVCSGKSRDNKATYALLDDIVPATAKLNREEALARLAGIYFNSHGPATLQDFSWWSGLNTGDARKGLNAAAHSLEQEHINGACYWFTNKSKVPAAHQPGIELLPAYDEYLISYKDRSASLPSAHSARVLSANGIFRPVVLIDGQVSGLWKRSFKKDSVLVETEGLGKLNADKRKALLTAAQRYADFLGKELILKAED